MELLHLVLSLVSRYSSMFQRKFCKYCTKRLFPHLMCSFSPFPPLVMAVTDGNANACMILLFLYKLVEVRLLLIVSFRAQIYISIYDPFPLRSNAIPSRSPLDLFICHLVTFPSGFPRVLQRTRRGKYTR